ncbi:MAG: glycoside hydrolase family 15 protein, partial [Desulfurivibrionaceae bacterium]
MYKKISEYGIIGNLHSVALVGLDGSIDWMCLPHLDSASVFGALLDDRKGGCFAITPVGEYDSCQQYVPETNVLVTRFRTRKGQARVTDFMPVRNSRKAEEESSGLYRLVEAEEGIMELRILFAPRFDYAGTIPSLEQQGSTITARGSGETLVLCSSRGLEPGEQGTAEGVWQISPGQKLGFYLHYGAWTPPSSLALTVVDKSLRETREYWQKWLRSRETGRFVDPGPYREMLDRSALVLKLLQFNPTGTIAAAATTSLPESMGGERNWDYRFTWLRDSSFTLQALFNQGHLSEMEDYLNWLKTLLSEHGVEKMQIMYGLRGETEIPEEELSHLEGYKGSRPVRIGNGAAGQKQLDIYGELMEAALKLSDYAGKIDYELWPFLREVCNYATDHWRERDYGVWEVRGGPYHFVYSKVMCWLALDRGLTIARRYGFPADYHRWESVREEIKNEVLEKGWSEKKKAFVQHYESEALDASNLLLPVLGFLPFDDPRVLSNLEATRRELAHGDFLYRYTAPDHLAGREGAFLLCTFWLIDNLVALDRLDESELLIHRLEGAANHLGLFSEEYDAGWQEALGNFPQAFTHIGYINSVTALRRARSRAEAAGKSPLPPRRIRGTLVLNDGEPEEEAAPVDLAAALKNTMNILRGAFFDTPESRVAYEQMRGSKPYREYLRLSYALKAMDLDLLESREERIAFWVNLYNVIVIHGVIELGIKDSVKEVNNFFRRITYRIGELQFSPDDIEHGILRGNSPPPYRLFKRMGSGDRRRRYSISPLEPRIHFALVCASSSCPPIDVYTPDNLDRELDIAGRTFLNSGGILLDREKKEVHLSRIMKWYGRDFAEEVPDRLRIIAPYLYLEKDREYLLDHADTLKVRY